jgi:hypothetical protein
VSLEDLLLIELARADFAFKFILASAFESVLTVNWLFHKHLFNCQIAPVDFVWWYGAQWPPKTRLPTSPIDMI